jgi:aryl-alcohol dehydrogenase-like predicted oxidoreductase
MLYRTFGKTGWRISQIGLGCWQFGGAITLDGKPDGWTGVDDAESIATIQKAVDLDVNFFDTADQYGWGHSEEVLGRALKASNARSKVHIASKVGFWHDADGRRTFNESRQYIVAACEASLIRLQTNYLDLYQCHLWRTERWPEFLQAFDQLQQQGKIRHYGVSTNDFDMVQHFDSQRKLTAVQANYNLLDRNAEKEILPYCRARGIAFIARGPLARGLLSGKYDLRTKLDPNDNRNRWFEPGNREGFERNLQAVERLRPVAGKIGCDLAQLAIKFVMSHVAVSTVIPGTKNRSQLDNNAATCLLPSLTADEQAAIANALAGPSLP